jgi:hypothetical protein
VASGQTEKARMTKRDPAGKTKTPKHWGPAPKLGPEIQGGLGEQLRELHEEIIRQGVPSRFVDLLAQLDEKKPDKSEKSG